MTTPEQRAQDDAMRGLLHDAEDVHRLADAEVLRRFEVLETRMADMENGVSENTRITASAASDTAELLGLFRSAKGGFKVMGWIGIFAKWTAGMLAMFSAIYAVVQNVRGIK